MIYGIDCVIALNIVIVRKQQSLTGSRDIAMFPNGLALISKGNFRQLFFLRLILSIKVVLYV